MLLATIYFAMLFLLQTVATNVGKIWPASPRREWSAREVRGVGSLLISTTSAFAFFARRQRSAAGCTTLDVPIDKKTSHFSAASIATSSASVGNISPNQMTSGRKLPPQDRHRPCSRSKLSLAQSFSKQRNR